MQVLGFDYLGDFLEIISHDTSNASVVLNKDEDSIQRLVSKTMAHHITVVVSVSFALAAWSVKNH